MNRWYEVDHYRIEPDDLIEPLAEELVDAGTVITFKVRRFSTRRRCGDQLRELTDLGYSEGQGVKMLDAVFPEGAA